MDNTNQRDGSRYLAMGVGWEETDEHTAIWRRFRVYTCKNVRSLSQCAVGMAPASLGEIVASISEEERL